MAPLDAASRVNRTIFGKEKTAARSKTYLQQVYVEYIPGTAVRRFHRALVPPTECCALTRTWYQVLRTIYQIQKYTVPGTRHVFRLLCCITRRLHRCCSVAALTKIALRKEMYRQPRNWNHVYSNFNIVILQCIPL